MVAIAEPTPATRTNTREPACEWRLFDHYSTLERAETKLTELTSEGLDARLSLIDGLSIIVRREHRVDAR